MANSKLNIFCIFIFICAILLSSLSLANNNKDKVFACNDFPPQKIKNNEDGLPGFDVEIVTEALKRSGYTSKFEFYPWKEAMRQVQEGQTDGLCSCSYRPEREQYFIFSDAIGYTSTGIFTKTDYQGAEIRNLNDLKGQLVGVVSGYNLEKELVNRGIDTLAAPEEDVLLAMFEAERFHYFYAFKNPVEFLLTKQKKQNQYLYHPMNASPYFLCASRKKADAATLIDAFNVALKTMAEDDTIKNILLKYR